MKKTSHTTRFKKWMLFIFNKKKFRQEFSKWECEAKCGECCYFFGMKCPFLRNKKCIVYKWNLCLGQNAKCPKELEKIKDEKK